METTASGKKKLQSVPPTPKHFVPIPYIRGLYEIVQQHLRPLGVNTYPPPMQNMRALYSHQAQGRSNFLAKCPAKEVVYAIPCNDCNSLYIGQTGRDFKSRLAEHERGVRSRVTSNAIAKHVIDTGHQPKFEKSVKVYNEPNVCRRLALEAFTIAINRDRLMNLSPPSQVMIEWIDLSKRIFPDRL